MTETIIARNLKRLMEARGYGRNKMKLSLDAGLNETAVRDILTGKSKDPRNSTLQALATALQCTINDIVMGSSDVLAQGGLKPLDLPIVYAPLLTVAEFRDLLAGEEMNKPFRRVIPLPYNRNTLVALTVASNAMNRVAAEGATIVVDYADIDLQDGKLYVIEIDDNTTWRRYRATQGPERFEPESVEAGHPTVFLNGGFYPRVLGRVVMTAKEH